MSRERARELLRNMIEYQRQHFGSDHIEALEVALDTLSSPCAKGAHAAGYREGYGAALADKREGVAYEPSCACGGREPIAVIEGGMTEAQIEKAKRGPDHPFDYWEVDCRGGNFHQDVDVIILPAEKASDA